MTEDQELPKEEAERRAREVAQRMLTTPKHPRLSTDSLEDVPTKNKAAIRNKAIKSKSKL
jgi:hypothetical protein